MAVEGGLILKLVIASLVKMGYQVNFDILQAGHFGVGQTRRRLIITGAAPGERLPLSPAPVYSFSGPLHLGVDIDGRHITTTAKRPGTPRQALTTWDAISDLPPVESGASDVTIAHTETPKSP